MKNLLKFNKSPILNLFKDKPKSVKFSFLPEESKILEAMKVVKTNWQEKQDEDPSISDEYKKFQVVSKVIKIYPKHEKERIHLIYDILELGLFK